jgi:predicted ribosome quality control (RQC) complex YloA/Tae2 family protein
MDAESLRPISAVLDGLLRGRAVRRIRRPDSWSLGLDLASGGVLGFCWDPARPAAGICLWQWPKGAPEDALAHHLKGARILGVTAVENEPILRLEVSGGPAGSFVWEPLGRSSNAFLLGESDRILWSGRTLKGDFRTGEPGTTWTPPPPKQPGGVKRSGIEDASAYIEHDGPEALLDGLLERGRRAAISSVGRREKAVKRKRLAVLADRVQGEGWIDAEATANALLASGDLHRRGETLRRVVDYAADPPGTVDVPLDPAKTVLENVDGLFRKVRKGRARMEATRLILEEISSELRTLEAKRAYFEACEDLSVLFPEGRRVRSDPAPQARRALPQGVAGVPLPLGFAGYAGKSAVGNDTVSFKIGKGSDFWFHAEDYPGCHVVVRNPRRVDTLPPVVEQAAALYAARHSGAPGGNRLAVTVSRCKNLRRVAGSPGRVMISSHRTVFVDLPRSE